MSKTFTLLGILLAAALLLVPTKAAVVEEGASLCNNATLTIVPPTGGSTLYRLFVSGAQHPYYIFYDFTVDTTAPILQWHQCDAEVTPYATQQLGPFYGDINFTFGDPGITIYFKTYGGSGGVFETSNWASTL